ncbi:MAG: serine acetyltransferase [Deltaproteobacteria bacterium]|nr:serine acetyltransferase [Deltaproteobacteria bacterium]
MDKISCKDDYRIYLEADRISLNKRRCIHHYFDEIWRFQKALRRLEYLSNTHSGYFQLLLAKTIYRRMSVRLGFTIPVNCFGPGLSIAHYGTIVVNGAARIGANCRIHTCTNIGTGAGTSGEAPRIGNNCYIGPGAKIYGKIILGDNVVIGANSVVNQSFPMDDITIAGNPADIISHKGSNSLLIHGYRINKV